MKAKLAPGAELEFVTPHELQEILDGLRAKQPLTIRAPESFVGDANGAIGVTSDAVVYQVPLGFEFRVHILRVQCDGHTTMGQILQNGGGFYQLLAGDQAIDDAVLDSAKSNAEGIPLRHSFSRDQAPVARNGEQLKVVVGGLGLAAGTRYSVYVQGTLVRPEDAIAEPA